LPQKYDKKMKKGTNTNIFYYFCNSFERKCFDFS